ncbi:MAG: PAS domain S-box protein [Alphaproteobacteria bacterium]|nr:PAS domain S-box protein [Alphaproteobacteria bacterium]MBV9692498.1 PAS domain S-box protein [Alphaproteobacteria bacterium]
MERAFIDYLREAPVFIRLFSGRITYWTEGAEALYGFDWNEAVGENAHALLKTGFPEPLERIEQKLLKESCWQGLLSRCRKDGKTIWVESRWRLKGEDGEADEGSVVIETNTDVTQREMLLRELNHRVKNTIDVIRGLARISLKSCHDTEEFREFERRLIAVAQSHDMLVANRWDFGEIREIVTGAAQVFHMTDRFVLSGDKVFLNPSSVLAYTLAMHELITNSIKYGALSVPDGHVEVSWQLVGEDGSRIQLTWRERGGPPVHAPQSTGFGTRLIQSILDAELGGAPLNMRFEPDGLVCEFDGPTQKAPEMLKNPDGV